MKLLYTLKDDQYEFNGITHNRIAARAIVLNEENKIGLLKVYGDDSFGFRDYYETPGGGVKQNESVEYAVVREVLEELGVEAEIIDEIGIVEDDYNLIYRHNIVYYFLLKVVSKKERHLEDYEKNLINQIEWLEIDEAINKMKNVKDTKLSILQKRREIPILEIARKKIFENCSDFKINLHKDTIKY